MENYSVMEKKKKVGIYGGSFDPIHFGHLALVISLKEAHALDEVILVPTQQNPHKMPGTLVKAEHRVRMLELALKDLEGFSISTIELERPAPSYTIDTIKVLKKKKNYKDCEFFLLMGEDLLPHFTDWKEPGELIKLVKPLVARRHGVGFFGAWYEDPELKTAIMQGLTETPFFDISSTNVRLRLQKGLYCGHLVPYRVLEYIKKNKLYT